VQLGTKDRFWNRSGGILRSSEKPATEIIENFRDLKNALQPNLRGEIQVSASGIEEDAYVDSRGNRIEAIHLIHVRAIDWARNNKLRFKQGDFFKATSIMPEDMSDVAIVANTLNEHLNDYGRTEMVRVLSEIALTLKLKEQGRLIVGNNPSSITIEDFQFHVYQRQGDRLKLIDTFGEPRVWKGSIVEVIPLNIPASDSIKFGVAESKDDQGRAIGNYFADGSGQEDYLDNRQRYEPLDFRSPEDIVIEEETVAHFINIRKEVLTPGKFLTQRMADIVLLLIYAKFTRQEISDIFGVTASYISEIYTRAKSRIFWGMQRNYLEALSEMLPKESLILQSLITFSDWNPSVHINQFIDYLFADASDEEKEEARARKERFDNIPPELQELISKETKNKIVSEECSVSPKETWLKRNRNPIIQITALILVIGAWIIGFYFFDDIEALKRYGYTGAFLVPMLDNFVTFINVGSFMIIAYLANILNPLFVGLLAGLGGTLGQFSSYLLGYSGVHFIIKKIGIYRSVANWMDKWGGKFIFTMSILPLPLVGFTGIAAGAAEYNVFKYFSYSLLGNILKHIGYCFIASWILSYLLPKISQFSSWLGVSDTVGLILISITTILALGLFSMLGWALFKKILPGIVKFARRVVNSIKIIALILSGSFIGGSGQGGLSGRGFDSESKDNSEQNSEVDQMLLSPRQKEALDYVFAVLRAVKPLEGVECSSAAAIDSKDNTISIGFERKIKDQQEVIVDKRAIFKLVTINEVVTIRAFISGGAIVLIFKADRGTTARTSVPLNEPREKTKARIDEVLKVYLEGVGKIDKAKLEKGDVSEGDASSPGSAATAFKNLITGPKTLKKLMKLAGISEDTARADVNALRRLKLVIYEKEDDKYKLNIKQIPELADPEIQQQIFEYLNKLPHSWRIYKSQDNEILVEIYNLFAIGAARTGMILEAVSQGYAEIKDYVKAAQYHTQAAITFLIAISYRNTAELYKIAARSFVRLRVANLITQRGATDDIFNQLLAEFKVAKPKANIQLVKEAFEFAKPLVEFLTYGEQHPTIMDLYQGEFPVTS